MVDRTILAGIKKALTTFPAIVLTGPRQSGKTTLLKTQFGKTHSYVNLEDPNVRMLAKTDPISFMKRFSADRVIVDEIQYVPELLSYIKTAIDEDRTPGRWLLTGSQNFALMQGVSQSLAGRAAIFTLLPLSISEISGMGKQSASVEDWFFERSSTTKKKLDVTNVLVRGGYPEIATNSRVDRNIWCSSYINTYLERDIRNLKQVGDLGQYEIFLRSLAARNGQILDLSSVASDVGVSFTTAKRWLSLLETGYQIVLVYPYYRNFGKRLVKRPKIYFTDTGLASYLLGSDPTMPNGTMFETLVMMDFWKRAFHHGENPAMYYLRTHDGLEVDLVIEKSSRLILAEIKFTATVVPEHAASLMKAKKYLGERVSGLWLISNSSDSFLMPGGVRNVSVYELPY